jgi:hypothetical protein
MTEVVINLRYLAESQPSLCIPRVFNNITETRIRQVFDELEIGRISRIDIKERNTEKGESFKRVYVHFEKWFWNEDAQAARRKLISGKEIKIVYDNPWFWKVSASKWVPPTTSGPSSAPPPRQKAHIEFDNHPRVIDHNPRVTDEIGRERQRSTNNRRNASRDFHRTDNRNRIPDKRVEEKRSTSPTSPPPEKLVSKSVTPSPIQYANGVPPPPSTKRFGGITLKKKQAITLVEEEEEDIDEICMTEEDKKDCEELYGDITF